MNKLPGPRGFTLDLLEDLLPPSGSDHTFDGNRLREIPTATA
jgi:hypothetical protein